MSKEAVFTIKLKSKVRADFMAETEAAHVREYGEFLRRKVDVARSSMRASLGRSNEEVEAEFTARRASTASQA